MVNRVQHKLNRSKTPGELVSYIFKIAAMAAILDTVTKMVLTILSFHVAATLPTKIWLNLTYRLGANEV